MAAMAGRETGASILFIDWKNDEERESGPHMSAQGPPTCPLVFPVAAIGVFLAHGGDGVHEQAPGDEDLFVRRVDGEDETGLLGLEMDVAPTPLLCSTKPNRGAQIEAAPGRRA